MTSDSGSSSTTISTAAVRAIMETLKNGQHAGSTKLNYYAIWKSFNTFFISLDVKPNNWEDRIALFVAYLVNKGRKSTTICSYLSALRVILASLDEELNENNILLSSMVSTCKRTNDVCRH